jgi:hypothetical protein
MEALIKVQSELRVPKGNFNSFGKYKYRSCEDILEAVKPILLKHNSLLYLNDSIQQIGTKLFLKATACFVCGDFSMCVDGFAEMGDHKGMSSEQCTGTASSYARKYALNGLFLIDETEADPDHDKQPKQTKQPLPADRFEKAKEALKAGKIELQKDLIDKFDLTPVQLNELTKS